MYIVLVLPLRQARRIDDAIGGQTILTARSLPLDTVSKLPVYLR